MLKRNEIVAFSDVGRLPDPGDNAAIATRRLEAGTRVRYRGEVHTIHQTILEGHRFTVRSVAPGEALKSWRFPFGHATAAIPPFAYICNDATRAELERRRLDFPVPPHANFEDYINTADLSRWEFKDVAQVEHYPEPATFQGYPRPEGRGVGTRNYVVLLGTTALTSSLVLELERRLAGAADAYPNVDGIVAVAHTEGGHAGPNNTGLVLRTLAGFIVHPNVGAVLAVDYGTEAITNAMLAQYLEEHNYPFDPGLCRFLSVRQDRASLMEEAAAWVTEVLPRVDRVERRPMPLRHLNIALQCGGSDAFSGVSGNPLAAAGALEVIRHGGSAVLAETDELVGAEAYILERVRSVDTARRFVEVVERFKRWAGRHGVSVEGNPSGGNRYRGLYNIALKSIGAAMKKHPRLRLDDVLDYGARPGEPGFYFMDSPGNDLESIAGQVASGCNLIYFVTGNGSITNFPFVPTLKIVTTSARFALLRRDMDVNAGRYLDGEPMDRLAAELFEQTRRAASGERTVGERAGHAQVQLWRDWRQASGDGAPVIPEEVLPGGNGYTLFGSAPLSGPFFTARQVERGYATEAAGLILPTSLCAGQVARMMADRLNHRLEGKEVEITRYVAVAHTEGCGVSSNAEGVMKRTLVGYLAHPNVRRALILEHGCEKTHNDYMRLALREHGLDPDRFGWASIQRDGGIDAVTEKVEAWFAAQESGGASGPAVRVGLEALVLGIAARGTVSGRAAGALAGLTRAVVGSGGTVILPHGAPSVDFGSVLSALGLDPEEAAPTLGFAQRCDNPGLHLMATPTEQPIEIQTALGACGIHALLVYCSDHPTTGNPLVPVLQWTDNPRARERYRGDFDLYHDAEGGDLLSLVVDTLEGSHRPSLSVRGDAAFQISRGRNAVSL